MVNRQCANRLPVILLLVLLFCVNSAIPLGAAQPASVRGASANDRPAAYSVTFTESGLPAGTAWKLTFDGSSYTGSGNLTIGNIANGQYPFVVGSVANYTASPSSGTITVNGANVTQGITFTGLTTYSITFTEVNLPAGTSWSVTFNDHTRFQSTSTIVFTGIGPGKYSWSAVQTIVCGDGCQYTASPASGETSVPFQTSQTVRYTLTSPMSVSCAPSSATVGSAAKCMATVSGLMTATGKVTWTFSGGSGKFSSRTCKLSKSACSVKFTPTSVSIFLTINASYQGDKNNPPSSAVTLLPVSKATSKTSVVCSPSSVAAGSSRTVRCTATVRGYSPTGTVEWSIKSTIANITLGGSMPFGDEPTAAAFVPPDYVYVTDSANSTVSVIDTSTNAVIATIPAGLGPSGIAFAPSDGDVYVANSLYGTVSVIDASTRKVVATIPVGLDPSGIVFAPSNDDVYVANAFSNTVSVISTSTNTVVAEVTVGGFPGALAFVSANDAVYVAQWLSNTTAVIDTSTNTVVATIPVGAKPSGIAFVPSNADVYVTNFGSNTTSVIDVSANAVVATIPVGSGPNGIAFASSDGDVYVANLESNTTTVIAASTDTVFTTIRVGWVPMGVAFASSDADVYVTNLESDTVSVISAMNSGAGLVSFSPSMCSLAKEHCSLTVTGVSAGSVTILVTYSGDQNNGGSHNSFTLKVIPSKTSLLEGASARVRNVGHHTLTSRLKDLSRAVDPTTTRIMRVWKQQ